MSALTFTTTAALVVALLVTLLTSTSAYPSENTQQHLRELGQKPLQYIRHTDIRKLPKFRPTLRKLFKSRSQSQTTTTLSTEVAQATTEIEPNLESKGYTFDPCFYHVDCVDERLCIRSDWKASCSGSANCLCMAPAVLICNKCTDCEQFPEETCIEAPSEDGAGLCGSVYTVWEGITVETDCDSFPNITPVPGPEHGDLFDSTGLSADGSTTYSGGNTAHALPSDRPPQPTISISTNSSSQNNSVVPTPSPFDNSVVPTTSPFDNSVVGKESADGCIDAKALDHLSASERVFKEHRRASVLCDSFGSCATPGHMVVVNGRNAMSMHSYCVQIGEGGCSRRVMEVNSPKFRRGVRVASKTAQLQFTAFSATYLTRLEEHALRTLIHMGM